MTKWLWKITKEGDDKPATIFAGIVYWNKATKEVLGLIGAPFLGQFEC
jgi:hypothetical protein